MANYLTTDTELTSVANAIRTKGGTASSLEYPSGFVTAINNIPTGTPINNQNKTKSYTPSETAQSETVTADSGYTGLGEVAISVGAISSSYVGSGITRRSSSDLTASGATVTAPSGYYSSSASKSVASGSVTAPATISATGATKSTSSSGITLTKTVSVTPNVTTAGYISSGTAGNASVSLTATANIVQTTTHHPQATDLTLVAGSYLNGNYTMKGVTTTNLTAENIKNGVTVKIGDDTDDDCVTSVTGTYSGGGGSAVADVVTTLSSGGDYHAITGVDISSDTVTASHLETGYTAHDATGTAVTGTLSPGGGTAYIPVKLKLTNTTYSTHLTAEYYATSTATKLSGSYFSALSTSSWRTVYLPQAGDGTGILILIGNLGANAVYYPQIDSTSTGVTEYLSDNPSSIVEAKCQANAEIMLSGYYDN